MLKGSCDALFCGNYFFPYTIFGENGFVVPLLSMFTSLLFSCGRQCICVTLRAEVKGLHMIISLGAVASRLTLVLVQHSGVITVNPLYR